MAKIPAAMDPMILAFNTLLEAPNLARASGAKIRRAELKALTLFSEIL
jgi:hypothetical protein